MIVAIYIQDLPSPIAFQEDVGCPHHLGRDVGLSPRNLDKVSGDGLSSGRGEVDIYSMDTASYQGVDRGLEEVDRMS